MENLELGVAIATDHRIAEAHTVRYLRALQPASAVSKRIQKEAVRLTKRARATSAGPLSAESFLRNYGLSTRKGMVQSKGRRMKAEGCGRCREIGKSEGRKWNKASTFSVAY